MAVITVNQLTVTLTLLDGQTITVNDTNNDILASKVLDELTKRASLIYVGDGLYITPRAVTSASVTMSQRDKRVPDPCPSGDPCADLDPPVITIPEGILQVGVGEEFDPLDGVTAIDGYGEPLEVTVTVA